VLSFLIALLLKAQIVMKIGRAPRQRGNTVVANHETHETAVSSFGGQANIRRPESLYLPFCGICTDPHGFPSGNRLI
jgi:hypothetical protein